ncbi:MAG: response regulator transcription factor, partial [Prevotellamassilia sp.]|nr:response regulator transcription factor [Prevotellamassilia sp.]
ILLDVMLGGMSGFQLAEKLRKEQHNLIPIIFLTARDAERDLLTGFSAGGDDYIAKPFSLQVVLARIGAMLRRSVRNSHPASFTVGGMVVDFGRKVVTVGTEDVRLSPKEFGILSCLAKQPGRVFSREEILAEVWPDDCYVLDRTVDVHIARVRRKLGEEGNRISNRQGYGYCFEA